MQRIACGVCWALRQTVYLLIKFSFTAKFANKF